MLHTAFARSLAASIPSCLAIPALWFKLRVLWGLVTVTEPHRHDTCQSAVLLCASVLPRRLLMRDLKQLCCTLL